MTRKQKQQQQQRYQAQQQQEKQQKYCMNFVQSLIFFVLLLSSANGFSVMSTSSSTTSTTTTTSLSMQQQSPQQTQQQVLPPPIRPLPEKLLIGYANTIRCCDDHADNNDNNVKDDNDENDDKILQAVQNGVNVIVWAFLELQLKKDIQENDDNFFIPVTSLDLEQVRKCIHKLDSLGYNDTVHLISFGGWNGPHLETTITKTTTTTTTTIATKNETTTNPTGDANATTTNKTTSSSSTTNNTTTSIEHVAKVWYSEWKDYVGDIFHGIDWDLEGHDDLSSPTNEFSYDCLEFMGQISQLAKQDGYIIGMAPPQSYLNIHSSNFSRRVNLTESNVTIRPWHAEFSYFGANVYAYLLSKYGDLYIDFVSIQFYESYSLAAMDIYYYQTSPSTYLENYIKHHVLNNQESFLVNFATHDPSLQYPNCQVSLPLSKLVWGFANGWAKQQQQQQQTNDNDNNNNNGRHEQKTLYVEPKDIEIAYNNLQGLGIAPRGMMFWVIIEEGTNGVYYSQELNKILKIRPRMQKQEEQEQEQQDHDDDATTSAEL